MDTPVVVGVSIAVGLIVLFILNWTRTAKLNVDPLQNALMELIDQLSKQGHSQENQDQFSSLAAAYFQHYGITREGEKQTRLAHALSLMKLRLPPEDFRQTVRFLEAWTMPVFRPTERDSSQRPQDTSDRVDVFVSYAREEKKLVSIVVARLESRGFQVWWDDGIQTGAQWESVLRRQLELARAVVVLWSPLSSVSEWVRTEAAFAREKGNLIPVFLRRCRLPSGFGEIQTSDLSEWAGDPASAEWMKLLSAIEMTCQRRRD